MSPLLPLCSFSVSAPTCTAVTVGWKESCFGRSCPGLAAGRMGLILTLLLHWLYRFWRLRAGEMNALGLTDTSSSSLLLKPAKLNRKDRENTAVTKPCQHSILRLSPTRQMFSSLQKLSHCHGNPMPTSTWLLSRTSGTTKLLWQPQYQSSALHNTHISPEGDIFLLECDPCLSRYLHTESGRARSTTPTTQYCT